jgi:hypothetical protein
MTHGEQHNNTIEQSSAEEVGHVSHTYTRSDLHAAHPTPHAMASVAPHDDNAVSLNVKK